ncbi:serine protease [Vibrio hannami]|nr:serine protease [Vibrio hannami]MDG3088292.1 serine protease [Vibrio hannami]
MSSYAALPETIAQVKPSIVGIGTYSRIAKPNSRFLGTGFFVKSSEYVATNAHVVPDTLDDKTREKLVVFVGTGRKPKTHIAEVVVIDHRYDLAILKISGANSPAMKLSRQTVREGEEYAFTGFPIGSVLGLYPVTHQGIVSSITPIVIPARTSKELTIHQLKSLREPYKVYQLDATAYPGNSGSPVYHKETGEVVAVINKVLVKSTKESALTDPTAITYAIPIKYLYQMLKQL